MSTSDLICLGEPMVEFNQLPEPDFYKAGFGGDTSNTAIAAARQGTRVGYLTALGADHFGDSLMELWRREAVDSSQVKRVTGAATGIYFVTHGNAGHQFHYYRAGSAASRMQATDLPLAYLQAAKILHVSAISQAISETATETVFAAIEVARKAGVKICYDTNLRLALWPLERARAVIERSIACTDILRPALDDAQKLTGLEDPDAILDHYLAKGPGIVAMTMGRRGVLLGTSKGRHHLPAHNVVAVDATGAGDTFNGAFLSRLIAGDTPVEAAGYANAAAALSTTGYGAVSPIPFPEGVARFRRKQAASPADASATSTPDS